MAQPDRERHAASRSVEAARFDLFRWLPADIQDAFVAASRPRRLGEGAIVYTQGDVANEMYRIVSGVVRLSTIRIDGREFVYSLFGAPASFGYSSLIDRKGLPHTAMAQTDLELQVLSLAAFRDLRARHRELDEAMLQGLCGHMRTLSTLMGDATMEELRMRVLRRLIDLAPADGGTGEQAIQLSQSELGAMLGVSRQAINKLLKQFEDEGLVRVSYGSVILRDLAALRVYSA